MSRNVAKSEAMQLEILTVVGRFGWMRLKEISMLIWKDTQEVMALTYAYKMIKKLETKQYVHLEKLEGEAGMAVLLTDIGIRFLSKNNVAVTKVKFQGDKWVPPSTWKHDVLTTGIFVSIMNRNNLVIDNARYLTDRECTRILPESTHPINDNNGLIKKPDLIIETNLGLLAIEIERAPKTGKANKEALVETLIKTNIHGAPYSYMSLRPNLVVIAYDKNQKHIRACKEKQLHHGKNIFHTVQEELKIKNAKYIEKGEIENVVEKIRVLIFEMDVRNYGVQTFEIIDEILPVDEIRDYFKSDAYLYGHSHNDVLRWLFPIQYSAYQ
jgi:hypothetical protein